jgi:heme/copper-type cytochrome/quinol oxidase subunit 1
MNLSSLTLAEVLAIFSAVGVVVAGIYKFVVWRVGLRNEKQKELKAAQALEITQSGDLQKYNIDQLKAIIETRKQETKHHLDVIDQLQKEVETCDENEKKRQLLLSKKAKLWREMRRCVETIQYETITKNKPGKSCEKYFTRQIEIIDEYEKLMEFF